MRLPPKLTLPPYKGSSPPSGSSSSYPDGDSRRSTQSIGRETIQNRKEAKESVASISQSESSFYSKWNFEFPTDSRRKPGKKGVLTPAAFRPEIPISSLIIFITAGASSRLTSVQGHKRSWQHPSPVILLCTLFVPRNGRLENKHCFERNEPKLMRRNCQMPSILWSWKFCWLWYIFKSVCYWLKWKWAWSLL